MSGDVFQRAEFVAGYTAAFWGGERDLVRPPAWQDGFELFGKITVEPWQVERLVNYEPPIPPPDPHHPEFVVFTPPPDRYRRPRKPPKPKPLVWREKKKKIRMVTPWLEEIFAIPGAGFHEMEKMILRKRFEGYTFVEIGKKFGLQAQRVRAIQGYAARQIRDLMWKKGIVFPDVEDVRPRLVA